MRKIDLTQPGNAAGPQYGIRTIPSIWVYNKEGKLIARGESDIGRIKILVADALSR